MTRQDSDPPKVRPDIATRAGISGKSASRVGLASGISALAGIAILLVVSRTLSVEANAEFLAFWAALFFVQGTLGGIQAESTRSTHAVALGRPQHRGRLSRPLASGLIVGSAAGAVILALWPLGKSLFPANPAVVVSALALFAVLYSGHAALAGSLQGTSRWGLFAGLVTAESLARFLAILAAAVFAAPLIGMELACLASLTAWIGLVCLSPQARAAILAPSDAGLKDTLRQTGHALLSAASSATLVVGFPILVKITATADEYALSAPLLLAVSMTRAPIMIPLQAFQGVAMNLIMQAGKKATAYSKAVGVVLGVGIAGAVLAYLLGPTIMTIFGPEYRVSGWVMAGLTFAASLMALITLTGTAAIARGLHRIYSAGWLAGTVASILILLVPLPLDLRCVLSLTVGPVVGISIHILALVRVAPTSLGQ